MAVSNSVAVLGGDDQKEKDKEKDKKKRKRREKENAQRLHSDVLRFRFYKYASTRDPKSRQPVMTIADVRRSAGLPLEAEALIRDHFHIKLADADTATITLEQYIDFVDIFGLTHPMSLPPPRNEQPRERDALPTSPAPPAAFPVQDADSLPPRASSPPPGASASPSLNLGPPRVRPAPAPGAPAVRPPPSRPTAPVPVPVPAAPAPAQPAPPKPAAPKPAPVKNVSVPRPQTPAERRGRSKSHERKSGGRWQDEPQQQAEEASGAEEGWKIDPMLYFNRELSLLEFQRRVLEEAGDPRNPLLERVKFMGIFASNMDEFFMVRVGGLRKQVSAGVTERSPDGMTPAEQLASIRKVAQELFSKADDLLKNDIIPALRQKGVAVCSYDDLTDSDKAEVKKYFDEVVFPVLTPMAFDPGHPFPHVSNLSLNLAVLIRDEEGLEHFARLKIPASIPRLLRVRGSGAGDEDDEDPAQKFVWLEQVIMNNLRELFPGLEVVAAHPFRVTRNADMIIQELEAEDLLDTMEASLRSRRFGEVVRMTVNPDMPPEMLDILATNVSMDKSDIYVRKGPLGLGSLMGLYSGVDRPDLQDAPFQPYVPNSLKSTANGDFFAAIRRNNFLLHHPYDSFSPVVDFLKTAAEDPDVLAIKQTLYRVGRNSPVVKALLRARENDKQVAVLVELKARFDETSNIEWTRMLEREGVHVIYGLLGVKTHSKIALVVRKESDRIRRYVHLSTGNYNAVTAMVYEDFGFFTTDDEIGQDATDLFNFLTGYSNKRDYRKLIIAPINLRSRFESLIRREIEHQKMGRQGHLIFKANAIVDPAIIQLLYQASQAGVKVDLIVRGICCLRPGIKGFSDNITVRSNIGRFLEHSRVYYFKNGGAEQIYCGSADLMPRNIDRRVEVLFPIEEKRFIRELRDDVLAAYLADNTKMRLMQSDGTYSRIVPAKGEAPVSVQGLMLMRRHQEMRNAAGNPPWRIVAHGAPETRASAQAHHEHKSVTT